MSGGEALPTPCSRTSNPAFACRATASATRFAIEPPDTSTPLESAGKPIASASQAITRSSTWRAPSCTPAACGFIPEARMSASTGRVGDHVALDLLVHRLGGSPATRQGLSETRAHGVGERPPDGPLPHRGEIIDPVVVHVVPQGAQVAPRFRVESALL